ncbi:MAG: isochorismatase family protein [Acidimicrobiales bacterium]
MSPGPQIAGPQIVDRSEMQRRLNEHLVLDPATTAVLTIDCHRGHLDPEVATQPVAADTARSVVANVARLLDGARHRGVAVLHVILQNRVLRGGEPEPMRNPFWRAVEDVHEMLTPGRKSTIIGHNLEGSVQTELMPELGPEPGDLVFRTKRRLSVFRDTDLEHTLRALGITTVLLVGINTNTCVQCAAFESCNRDLATVVISDCVGSMYGDDLHLFGLQNVARCLGWVLTTDEVLAKLGVHAAAAR